MSHLDMCAGLQWLKTDATMEQVESLVASDGNYQRNIGGRRG